MYFLISKLIFLWFVSCSLSMKLNRTRLFGDRFLSQLSKPGLIEAIEPWRNYKEITNFPHDDYSNDFEDIDSRERDDDLPEIERDDRNLLPEYRSLCQTKTRKVELSDNQYEYQPSHYHEVYCKSYSLIERVQAMVRPSQQMCAHPSFHCVQRSKTLFVVRRRWESECWEPYSKQVASGCECMWPVSSLGDITEHY